MTTAIETTNQAVDTQAPSKRKFKKKFSDLSASGQKKRLATYDKERAEKGTIETLARVVRPAKIEDTKTGDKRAIFRFAIFNKEKQAMEWKNMSAFIPKGKVELENWYRSITPKHLLSVEYKVENGYMNIWNIMDRTGSLAAKKEAAAQQAPAEQESERPLDVE